MTNSGQLLQGGSIPPLPLIPCTTLPSPSPSVLFLAPTLKKSFASSIPGRLEARRPVPARVYCQFAVGTFSRGEPWYGCQTKRDPVRTNCGRGIRTRVPGTSTAESGGVSETIGSNKPGLKVVAPFRLKTGTGDHRNGTVLAHGQEHVPKRGQLMMSQDLKRRAYLGVVWARPGQGQGKSRAGGIPSRLGFASSPAGPRV